MMRLLVAALPLAVLLAPALTSEEPVAPALASDDECAGAAEGGGTCDASFRQLRGVQTSSGAGAFADVEAHRAEGEAAEDAAEESGHNASRNIRTLYHQTSYSSGMSILRNGFRRGSAASICGSAIYFSPSVHDTDRKAVYGRGFVIQAKVDLGRVKHMPRDCNPTMTGSKLKSMGYDSITLDRGGYFECDHVSHCVEFIIYDKRRVLSMKGFRYHGWKYWWGPDAATGDNSTAAGGLTPVEGVEG